MKADCVSEWPYVLPNVAGCQRHCQVDNSYDLAGGFIAQKHLVRKLNEKHPHQRNSSASYKGLDHPKGRNVGANVTDPFSCFYSGR